ncbi:MAG: hypothetical protein ACJAXX_000664 [Roseivirga sp.]|jgi:hypothetical protein
MLSPYKFFRVLDIKNVAGETVQFYASDSTFINAEFSSKSDSIFSTSKELISRLERYKENYQKIE